MEQEITEDKYLLILSQTDNLVEITLPMGSGVLTIHRKKGMGNTEFFLKKADLPANARFFLWQK